MILVKKKYAKSWAFLPEDGVENKSKTEKVDYNMMKENGYAFLLRRSRYRLWVY